MSRVFVRTTNPPLNVHWRVWTMNDSITPDEIKNLDDTIAYITHMYPSLNDDIWNIIVWYMYQNNYVNFANPEPQLWEHNISIWMQYWVSTPSQHVLNPLKIVKNDFTVQNSAYAKGLGYDQVGVVFKPTLYNKDNVLIGKYASIGTSCIGIAFNPDFDTSNIDSCILKANNLCIKKPYEFQAHNSVNVMDENGELLKVWSCPGLRFIPPDVVFMDMNISLKMKDSKGSMPKYIKVVRVLPHIYNQQAYYLSDGEHQMKIYDGTIQYQ